MNLIRFKCRLKQNQINCHIFLTFSELTCVKLPDMVNSGSTCIKTLTISREVTLTLQSMHRLHMNLLKWIFCQCESRDIRDCLKVLLPKTTHLFLILRSLISFFIKLSVITRFSVSDHQFSCIQNLSHFYENILNI